MRKAPRTALVLSAAVLLGGTLLSSACSSVEENSPLAAELPSDAVEERREFPAFVYNSAQTLEAYRTAVLIAEVLPLMPCYCNCGEAHGHPSLKDCFFNEDGSLHDHGAFCEICDMEVMDIAQWQDEGYTSEHIRALIDEKYPAYGEPTDTPNPFESDTSSTPIPEPLAQLWLPGSSARQPTIVQAGTSSRLPWSQMTPVEPEKKLYLPVDFYESRDE